MSGAFVRSRIITNGVYNRLVDTFARRSAHNNSFITLRVIHELKIEGTKSIFKILDQHLHYAFSSISKRLLGKGVGVEEKRETLAKPMKLPNTPN